MKSTSTTTIILVIAVLLITNKLYAQEEYRPNSIHPFGSIHPDAPTQLADFDALIGESECSSTTRTPEGTWSEPGKLIWRWEYIMNGFGVMDQTFNDSGVHSGSIRQFNSDSLTWYVHYYSSSAAPETLPSWEGGKNEHGDIILYNEQTAPNGMEGFYKINFTEITETSFEWLGEWVDPDETISFPLWKISCKKKNY